MHVLHALFVHIRQISSDVRIIGSLFLLSPIYGIDVGSGDRFAADRRSSPRCSTRAKPAP